MTLARAASDARTPKHRNRRKPYVSDLVRVRKDMVELRALHAMDPQAFSHMTRKPKRMTITLPDKTFRGLVERSNREGRSMSNLSAFLLEQAMDQAGQQTQQH